MNVKAYQSDVRSLSDAELEALSDEIAEAYDLDGFDYSRPTDDEAEARFWEIRKEQRRRCGEPDPLPPDLLKGMLESIRSNLTFAKQINREFDQFFAPKVGNLLTIRKPTRFARPEPAC